MTSAESDQTSQRRGDKARRRHGWSGESGRLRAVRACGRRELRGLGLLLQTVPDGDRTRADAACAADARARAAGAGDDGAQGQADLTPARAPRGNRRPAAAPKGTAPAVAWKVKGFEARAEAVLKACREKGVTFVRLWF